MSKQECETNKKWILDLDSHFSEWSWHKSRVCIKIAACQSMQKEKSILHHHIKHEASSKLAYSHTQHHITHMLFRFYRNIYNLPDTSKKKRYFPMCFLKINHTHYEFKLMLHYLLNHISFLPQYTLQNSVG